MLEKMIDLRTVFVAVSMLLLVPGCQRETRPTSTGGVEQIARGKRLYEQHCAACHEADTGIGPRLSKKVIATHARAISLFDYTRRFMPYGAGNSLEERVYWDITGYVLSRHGFLPPGMVLGAHNAKRIILVPGLLH